MKVCGVELKSNEAIICLLSSDNDVFHIPDCRARRLTVANIHSREHLLDFQKTFAKLMEDYSISTVVIRERAMKGKFAGSAIGFKMEAAIELLTHLNVEIISSTDVKTQLKHTPLPVPFSETGLKAFQESALTTAFAYLSRKNN